MQLAKLIVSVVAAVFAVTPASGSISLIAPVTVDNSSGAGDTSVVFIPGDWVTNDLTINTTNDWTTGAILLELTSGSIFQHPNGNPSGLEPNYTLFSFVPALEFDTYLTNPNPAAPFPVGSGAYISCDPLDGCGQFDTTRLYVRWNSPGPDTNDIGEIVIGRITLSHDAQGSMTLVLGEAGIAAKTVFTDVPIVNGVIGVPEPGSLALLGVGGLALARRRG